MIKINEKLCLLLKRDMYKYFSPSKSAISSILNSKFSISSPQLKICNFINSHFKIRNFINPQLKIVIKRLSPTFKYPPFKENRFTTVLFKPWNFSVLKRDKFGQLPLLPVKHISANRNRKKIISFKKKVTGICPLFLRVPL